MVHDCLTDSIDDVTNALYVYKRAPKVILRRAQNVWSVTNNDKISYLEISAEFFLFRFIFNKALHLKSNENNSWYVENYKMYINSRPTYKYTLLSGGELPRYSAGHAKRKEVTWSVVYMSW